MSYVLIIEDDENTRAFLNINLVVRGFEVVAVGDAETGLAKIDEHPPALVLLDLGLPGMNGLEFLGQMSARSRAQTIPVVVISAWAQEQTQEAMMAHPQVVDMIPKPLSQQQLLEAVRRIFLMT